MKKFLTRALPLCLALLIFVSSLAVPALAAEIPPDYVVIPEESTIASGLWSFDEDASPYDVKTWLHGRFYYDGQFFPTLYIYENEIVFEKQVDDDWVLVHVRDADGNWQSSVRDFEMELDSACTDDFYSWFVLNVTASGYLLLDSEDSIFSVFTGISSWIVSSIGTIMPMFYSETTGLTFVGTLAVASLAFAVIFLIIAFIRRFMNFAG